MRNSLSAPETLRKTATLSRKCTNHGDDPQSWETPNYTTDHTTTPSPHHPIGAKGVGESPNVGGVPAFSNAVHDAFRAFGLRQTHMPHDHWRIWKTANNLGLHG